ncbi:MAG: YfhO family protein [Planctomycetota bacterium]
MTDATQPDDAPKAPSRWATAMFAPPTKTPMTKRSMWLAILVILVAPMLLLGESMFGDSVLFSYDTARFPPKVHELDDQTYDEVAVSSENNYLVTEIPAVFAPELSYAKDELSEGRFPGWNPYVRFGNPLFANGLIAILHPKNAALLLAWDPIRGLAWGAYVSVVFAGLLTFGLMRHLGVGAFAACFAAIGFELGGTMTANMHFYMRMDAIIAMPGMVWAVLCLMRSRGLKNRALPAAALSVLTALTWLSGFPPYAVLPMILCGVISVIGLARLWFTDRAAVLPTALWLLGGVFTGTALAFAQLGPMFAFFPESNRTFTLAKGSLYGDAFGIFGIPALLFPEMYGTPKEILVSASNHPLIFLWQDLRGVEDALLLPNYNFVEYTIFAGTLSLPLAALGALWGRGPARAVTVVCSAVFLLMALSPRLMESIPLLGSTPPFRFVMPLCLAIPILAGLGLQQIVDHRHRASIYGIAIASLVVATSALTIAKVRPLSDHEGIVEKLRTRDWPANVLPGETPLTREMVIANLTSVHGPAAFHPVMEEYERRTYTSLERGAIGFTAAALLLALAAFDRDKRRRVGILSAGFVLTTGQLVWLGEQSVAHRPYPQLAGGTKVHDFLHERQDEIREQGGLLIARGAKPNPVNNQQPYPHALYASTTLRDRFRDLNDYAFVDGNSHKIFHKLLRQRPNQPLDEFMYRNTWPRALPDDERLEHPLWDALAINTVLSDQKLDHAGTLATEPFVYEHELVHRGGNFYVYDRPNALPRAFIFHELETYPDEDAALEGIASKELDPRRAAHVVEEEATPLRDFPIEPRGESDREVRFASEIPHEIRLEVGDGPAGLLYLADTYLSGWTATVDGEEVPIVRSHVCMRTIPVPAGACEVVFSYRVPGLRIGLVLTGLALLITLFWTVAGIVGRFRR